MILEIPVISSAEYKLPIIREICICMFSLYFKMKFKKRLLLPTKIAFLLSFFLISPSSLFLFNLVYRFSCLFFLHGSQGHPYPSSFAWFPFFSYFAHFSFPFFQFTSSISSVCFLEKIILISHSQFIWIIYFRLFPGLPSSQILGFENGIKTKLSFEPVCSNLCRLVLHVEDTGNTFACDVRLFEAPKVSFVVFPSILTFLRILHRWWVFDHSDPGESDYFPACLSQGER